MLPDQETAAKNPADEGMADQLAARLLGYLERSEAEVYAGRYDEARSSLLRADQEIFALPSDHPERHPLAARAYWLQGMIYYHNDRTKEAREELLAAQHELVGLVGQESLLSRILNQLGNLEYLAGQSEAAVLLYQQSSAAALACGNHNVAATVMSNLGNVYIDLGRIEEASKLFEQSLQEAQEGGQVAAAAATLRAMALLHAEYGPVALGLKYADEAMALHERIEDQARLLTVLSDCGHVYLIAGNLDRAEVCFQKALVLAQQREGKLGLDGVLVAMAELNRYKGDDKGWYSSAIQAFNHASGTNYWKEAAAAQLARYYLDRPDWPKARKYITWLREHLAARSVSIGQAQFAHVEAIYHIVSGQWAAAAPYFAVVVATLKDTPYRYDLAWFYEDYGRMLKQVAVALHSEEANQQSQASLQVARDLYAKMQHESKLAELDALLATH